MSETPRKRISMERFQRLVVLLANQGFVRWYACLNWPQKPQILGLQIQEIRGTRLQKELEADGFTLRDDGIWVIERED